jgi:peptidyl-prolyl cis-trans isomerase C
MPAIALALAALLSPLAASAEDKVVATINGKSVTEADLSSAEAEIGNDLNTLPGAQKRLALIEYVIDNKLFAEAAEKEKLDTGPEFENKLAYLRQRALRELYFEKAIRNSVKDEEVRKIYDDQVAKLKPEEEVQARHILVESEAKAKELAEKVKGGEDFAKLAKENSKDTGSKDDGGMLGYFAHGQMVPQFEQAAFALKKGEVSAPVQSQFGWHIIKLEDRRPRQPPAYEVVKDRILNNMLLRKAQETAINLRSQVKIDYVDPDVKKLIEERHKSLGAPAAPAPEATPEK